MFSQHSGAIDLAATWSFKVALSNVFPDTDEFGEPIKGTRRYKSGKPLHPHGVRMVFAGTVGDWKWHVEAFNLQRWYAKEEVCEECHAEKSHGDLCMHNFLLDAPWTETERSLDEYLAEQRQLDTVSPFCDIEGWHTFNIYQDAVHTDMLGVRPLANGGAMWEIALMGYWGMVPPTGKWKDGMNSILAIAWEDFARWMHVNKKHCNISKFSCNNLSMHVQLDWPELQSKAASCATVTEWLAPIAVTVARRDGTHENRMRSLMLWGLDTLWQEYRNGWQLSDERAALMEEARKAFLLGYHACSKAHHARQSFIYPIIPKHHHFDHLLRRAIRTKLSPSLVWTFSEEDMMKWMSNVTGKAHGLGVMKGPIQRWLVFFCSTAQESLLLDS